MRGRTVQRRKLSPVLGHAWEHSGWDRVGVRTGLEEVWRNRSWGSRGGRDPALYKKAFTLVPSPELNFQEPEVLIHKTGR